MRQLKWLSLLGLLLLGPSTYAQSVRFQSQAISSRGAGIANATVAVCTQPANTNTQPCSPLATLATSTSTTSGGANPLTADSFGNFFFYAAPGRYTVQIYGPAVSGQFVIPDVDIVSTTGANGCQYVNANQTFAQALSAVNSTGCIEVVGAGTYTVSVNATIPANVTLVSRTGGILSIANGVTLTVNGPIAASASQLFAYVGTGTTVITQGLVEATWFPGANLGVQVNNAALALNSAKVGNTKGAGKIHIAAGNYSIPLGVMNPQADVVLSCDANQSTGLTFTGGSGVAILFNVGPVGGSYTEWGTGVENCLIYGPGYPSGSGQAGTGIQLGDATHGHIGVKITNNFIAGFTLGMTWGANGNSWGTKLDHTVFTLNTQDFVYNPNAGGGTENIEVDHVVFAPSFGAVIANDVVVGPGNTITDMWFSNCSFDNAQVVVSNASSVGFSKPHFEYGFNTTQPFASISGGGLVSMFNPVIQFDPSSGSVPAEGFLVANSSLDLYSLKANSNFAIPNYVNANTSNVRVLGLLQLTNIGGITSSGSRTLEIWNTTGSSTYSLIGGNFTVNTTGQVQFQAGSVALGGSNQILYSTTAPTIAAAGCGGGAASIVVANGTAAFKVNVGTTPSSACTLTFPAATTGWNVTCNDITTQSTSVFVQKQTGAESTTSVTITNFNDVAVATAFVANDILKCTAAAD